MSSDPDFEDTAEHIVLRPLKTHIDARPLLRRNRRTRFMAALLTLSLLALSVGVWMSPSVRQWAKGPSSEQIALATERAARSDLKRQLDDLNRKVKAPRPPATDDVDEARADDLAHQVEELEAKLGIGRPPTTDGVQRSRAEDLQARLRRAEAIIKAPHPPVTDGVAAARARDLAAQKDRLEAELTRPRPPVDPLANVTARYTKSQIVSGRNLFGMYTAQSPFNYGEVDLVQGLVQRKANTVGYFQSFTDPFNPFPIRNAWLRGQVPLMTWESQAQVGSITANQPEFSLPVIIRGDYDEYVRSYARGIRALGLPVIIRLNHEMNGTWYPWSEWADVAGHSINGNHQGDYVAMWRHIHDIFQAEGANDYAIWLWAPNRINRICGQRPPSAFYPGDAYTDWVGMSGYFRDYNDSAGPCDNITATFNGVFGATLPLLRAAGHKPIFLAEIGATENGGHKVAWVNDMFVGLDVNRDIIGFSWFNLSVSSGGELDRNTHDWRINSSAGPQDAMRAGLAASGFGQAPTG